MQPRPTRVAAVLGLAATIATATVGPLGTPAARADDAQSGASATLMNSRSVEAASVDPSVLTFPAATDEQTKIFILSTDSSDAILIESGGWYGIIGGGEDADLPGLLATLGTVQAAFGRGEVLTLDGRPVQLSLVKNPAGFRMGLLSAASQAQDGEVVVVAINDEYADGRDMSWLWDVDFTPLKQAGVSIVTGVRATDMALRLSYDDVAVGKVEADLSQALAQLVKLSHEQHRPIRILSTYTAMLELRSLLASYTDVEEVL